ncbi:hypothetical protein C3V36_09935 [Lachnospiraceae bacterium oral taxon 500]|nr:hypothetical protein C3V36_09935 [Lachnospiraceae bacterium oral taxon 500]
MKQKWSKIAALCLVFTLLAGQLAEAVTYSADRSTFFDGKRPNQFQNTSNEITIKYADNDFLRAGLIGFSLPQEDYSAVTKATLRLFLTAVSQVKPPHTVTQAAIQVFGFDSAWDAATVNWDNKPDFTGEVKAGEASLPEQVNEWMEVDITDYFKAKVANSRELSFHLVGDAVTKAHIKVASANHGNRPQLVLEKSSTPQTPPASGDTQVDVDTNNVDRTITMQDQDTMLKSLYVNQKQPDKNRDKTDTLLVGKEYSTYLYTDSVKVDTPDSAFLRFYVKEDYKTAPIPVEIRGLKNAAVVDENTTYQQPAETEADVLYELNITNQGWYTVDVTDYIKAHSTYGFYLKAKNDNQPVVKIASYHSEKTPVLYTSAGEDEFDRLRQKFAIQKAMYDLSDPQIQAMITRIDNQAGEYLTKLDTDPNRTAVFTNYPLKKDKNGKPVQEAAATNNMRNSYVWLNTLLRAYHTYGSKYENDAQLYQTIKDGLELLYRVRYNPFTRENGNWWQWEIGVPKALGEMIATMYSDLAPEVRMNYLNAIFRFQPNPEKSYYNRNSENPKEALPMQISVGANRVDTCIGDLLLGISAKNPDLIRHSVEALHDVYQYVDHGDGFYRDGSFVQHNNIAYTTAYGMVLISGLTDLNQKLKASRWQITDPDYQNVYAWLENSFIPMVYDGQAFPVTAGRSLSRQQGKTEKGSNYSDGYKIARMLYAAAQDAPEGKAEQWRSLARRYMEKNSFYDVRANATNPTMLKEYEDLQQNAAMAEPYIGSHVFANMDRVIHHRGNYAVALAMYSSRVQNFEMMNGENLKGWNQGNGALYLLNADCGQYDDSYWPTVNPLRPAGATIDVVTRLSVDHKEEFTMKSDFVGGVSLDGLYSAAAMDLAEPVRRNVTAYKTDLKAKKSWFFFDDEIIALGSGITSGDDRQIETIVENRMIRKDGSNQVLINGQPVLDTYPAAQEEFNDVAWAYLEGNTTPEASIGYYFPQPAKLSAMKQNRTGKWRDINVNGSDDVIERGYFTLWQAHGKKPVNEAYSYALLPGKTAEEMKAYADAPQYEVLANTGEVQAVYEKSLGILAANVFAAGADLQKVKVDQPCSLMIGQKDGRLSVAVSDPTMKLTAPVRVTFTNEKEIAVINHSSNVKVLQTKPLQLEISLAGAKGQAATLHGETNYSPATPYLPQTSEETKPQTEKTPSQEPSVTKEENNQPKRKEMAERLSDIQTNWAGEEIRELVTVGILNGYADHTFRPEAMVSRAETAQVLSNLLDYSAKEKHPLAQADGQPWYQAAVERVKSLGLMKGAENGNFYPNQSISRQDFFTVLGRFGNWQINGPEAAEILKGFADSDQVADYAKPYLAQLIKMGLVKGSNGRLWPERQVTRAELAAMISRVLKAKNK